ncbi:MAG: hypothetical protein NPIRA04_03220 [Nitrospirales bacterium]|nr:MAG: hypothetical protein NPIRA04_03220 [Nitrospirales bacterium]
MMSSTTVNQSKSAESVRRHIDEDRVFAPYFIALNAYEEQDIERRYQRLFNARTPWENRFEDDDLHCVPPTPPSIRLTPYHYVTLSDGRRAIRLDRRRALPLCGIQTPVLLTEAEQSGQSFHQGIKCQTCRGFHLQRPTRTPQSSVQSTTHDEDLEVRCPKCHASVLEIQHDGPFFTIHCFCGWLKEGYIVSQSLSQAELDHNERALAMAPIRDLSDCGEDNESYGHNDATATQDLFYDACENGDVDFIDDEGMMFSEESSTLSEESTSMDEDSETSSATDEQLVALENRFWLDRRLRPFRVALLEATMLKRIPATSVNLVWAVASNLAESCEHLSGTAQREVAEWVCQACPEDLEGFLPDREDQDDLDTSQQLPDIQHKIRKWQQACRARVNRFRYRQAGIRILAPKFGVSHEAFAVACQN